MSTAYPWYDSHWLACYVRATAFMREYHPGRLEEFVRTFDVLRTDPSFKVKRIDRALSVADHAALKAMIASQSGPAREKHEVLRFGRTVVHDAQLCTALQAKLVERMSEWVSEPVEPCYNFLSMYGNLGICRVHMDAPSAKWTLDYCIEQSAPWPMYLSRVRPWPEVWRDDPEWEAAVRNDAENHFTSFELHEGEAIAFGGSSQWHYRDRIVRRSQNNFCHLVFFHFVPKGTRHLTKPKRWAEYFAIPELAGVIIEPRNFDSTVIA